MKQTSRHITPVVTTGYMRTVAAPSYRRTVPAAADGRTPRHRYGWTIAAAVLVMILLAGYWGEVKLGSLAKVTVKPHVSAAVVHRTYTSADTMGQAINSAIAAQQGVDIGVTCVDLSTGVTYNYGTSDGFEAASVGKLIAATAFLYATETGQAHSNDTLDEADDNGDTAAGYELQAMIVNSDNEAWQAFTDDLGQDAVSAYARSIGISYDAGDNVLTTADTASLLQKLWRGQLLNKSDTNLLFSYMASANEAGYIPPAVPSGVKVYHKAGLLDDRIHDAAIINDDRRPYALVVFTNGHGTYDTPARQQLIQTIAKATVGHFIGS